ncbi:MAG: ComEC/Rec2 family competence protein [Thermomicrobiales bacterium]
MVGAAGAFTGSAGETLVLAGCLAFLSVMFARERHRFVAVALAGLLLGYGVTAYRVDRVRSVDHPTPFPSEFAGTVASDPRLGSVNHSARVAWRFEDGQSAESLVLYPGTSDAGRGDTVFVVGTWSTTVENLLFADKVEVVEEAGPVERLRRSIRASATTRVLERVPGSNGSLALGLIIGDDSGLTAQERADLRASGLSHITAVSGSNVAMVIAAVALMLQALGRRGRYWLAAQASGIVFYVWIIGADPPILRAAIMGSLVLVAGAIGRPTHLFTLLFLAGGAMCLLDPDVLLSLSFQLSFLSMIGLAIAGDYISRTTGYRRKIIAAVLSPAGAAIATAPLLAARFGTFNPGTLPANVIVAPIVTPATGLAALAAVIPDGFFTGYLIGFVLWMLTGVVLSVSALISSLPYATWTFSELTNAQTLACYLALGAVMLPFIPEARLLVFRLRVRAHDAPGLAAASVMTCVVMLGALSFIID